MGATDRWRFPSLVAVSVALAAAGCFAGYSSAWHQNRSAQRKGVEELSPSELRAGSASNRPVRTLKVRLWASDKYRSEVLQWKGHARDVVDRANAVLAPALGVELEVVGAERWEPEAGDDDLKALVDELEEHDAGDGVEWVIGLAGSLPTLARSMERLGQARMFGKHLVVRAPNDAEAYAQLEEAFPNIDDDELRELAHDRKAHKEQVVALHEIGHTLGALHVREAWAVLHPQYDADVSGYAPANVELMRIVLDHREDEAQRPMVEALLAHLTETDAAWIESERQQLVGQLRKGLEEADATTAAVAAGEPAEPTRLEQLPADVQHRFARVSAMGYSGEHEAAREQLAPMLDDYPQVYELRELACHLDTQRGREDSDHCTGLEDSQRKAD